MPRAPRRDQIAHQRGVDWRIEKPAAGNAGVDGFEHVHGASVPGQMIRRQARILSRRRQRANAPPNAWGKNMATDGAVTIAARLDRLPPSRQSTPRWCAI